MPGEEFVSTYHDQLHFDNLMKRVEGMKLA